MLKRERTGFVTYVEGFGYSWGFGAGELVIACGIAYLGRDEAWDVGGYEAILNSARRFQIRSIMHAKMI